MSRMLVVGVSTLPKIKQDPVYATFDERSHISFRYYIDGKSHSTQFEDVKLDGKLAERLTECSSHQERVLIYAKFDKGIQMSLQCHISDKIRQYMIRVRRVG